MARTFARLMTEDLNLGVGAATKPAPAGGILTGTQIGIHSFAVGGRLVSATWSPGSVPAGGKASTTVTVPGAAMGDFVNRSFDKDLQELQLTADVVSTNLVEVVLGNLTGAAVVMPSGTLRVLVFRSK